MDHLRFSSLWQACLCQYLRKFMLGITLLAPLHVAAQDPATSIVIGGSALAADAMDPNLYVLGEAEGSRPGGTSGVNLLHSLDQFDLNSADTALFTADTMLSTENIIARVTGGDVSDIWGTVEMDIAGANLFLLNPAGVLFGPSAVLNVQGGFHASTADTLQMQDNLGNNLLAFSGDVALAMAHPVAFGFLDASIGTITVDGATLSANASGGLSLVAGDISLQNAATIIGDGAGVELVSVSQAGDVDIISVDANGITLSRDMQDGAGLLQIVDAEVRLTGSDASLALRAGSIDLTDIAVDGDDIILEPIDSSDSAQYGGDIAIQAHELTLNSFGIKTVGGSIDIEADNILLQNTNGFISSITSQARQASTSTDIFITPLGVSGSSLSLVNSNIDAGLDFLSVPSNGGDIVIAGFDTVMLDGELASINTDIFSTARAGNIVLGNIDTLDMTNRAQIRSDARNNGALSGSVMIDARLINLAQRAEISTAAFSGANTTLAANDEPGSVTIAADEVHLTTGGSIESISVGAGDGGDIVIDTRILTADGAFIPDPLDLDPQAGNASLVQPSGVTTTVGFVAGGSSDPDPGAQGGDILINMSNGIAPAERIELTNGGRIGAEVVGGGTGGTVRLRADDVLVTGINQALADILPLPQGALEGQGGGSLPLQISRDDDFARSAIAADAINAQGDGMALVAVAGEAGSIELDITQSLRVEDGARIATFADEEQGNAGDITISNARLVDINSGGEITSASLNNTPGLLAGISDAGSININAETLVLNDGTLLASTVSGQGGSINLTASNLLLTQAEVNATTTGDGDAGSIDLSVTNTVLDNSRITASTTAAGAGGDIRVAGNRLSLENNAAIEVRSEDSGNAGNIEINLTEQFNLDNSVIASSASQAFGGNIDIASGELLSVFAGTVSTSVGTGVGSGGNVSLLADNIVLNEATVIAQADAGSGGNISIQAQQFFPSVNTVIDASANTGIDGQVQTTPPDTLLQQSLASLPAGFLDASSLVRPACDVAGAADSQGSLVVALRRGLPASPEELLASFDADWRQPANDNAMWLAANDSVALRTAAVDLRSANDAFRGGDYSTAEQVFARVSIQAPDAKQAPLQAVALRGLGESQHAQGKFAEAVLSLRGALQAVEGSDDTQQQAQIIGSLGNALVALGQHQEAQQLLQRGIVLAKDTGQPSVAAGITTNLGNAYAADDNWEEALDSYQQSAQLASDANTAGPAVQALSSAARAALNSSRYNDAIDIAAQAKEQFEKLLGDATAATPGQAQLAIAIHLAKTFERLADSGNADALSAAHSLLVQAMRLADRLGSDRDLSLVLGNLASLYMLEGRYDEAQYLTRTALRVSEQADAPDIAYRWHWQAGRIAASNGDSDAAISAYREAVRLLADIRQEALARYGSADLHFKQAVAPVYEDLVTALLAQSRAASVPSSRAQLLREARSTVEQLKAAELRDYFQNECVTELATRRADIETVARGAAVVYPIILSDQIELLVSLEGEMRHYSVAATAQQLEQHARSLRVALQNPRSSDYLQDAQQLYDWLIAPWIDEAEERGIETLVFVPDGALRSIPMAVLHDGQRYLIERFATAITPGLDLIDPKPLDTRSARLLAVGISESVAGFSPLANVPAELQAVQQTLGGDVFLNEDFQVARVEQAIADQRPTIVHIASHGVFSGDPNTSYLLAHDGRLTMDKLADAVSVAQFRDDSLELLMLSACQTAAGDDRAALGLAGVAIRAGARSAVGSLWSIADEAAYKLVVEFYTALQQPDTSRAQALQTAQQKLLANEKMAHPFFWSPFLLISNWL